MSGTITEEELREWIKRNVTRFPNMGFADDDPEEEYATQWVADADLIDIVPLSNLSDLPRTPIFVDGVLRYRVVGTKDLGDVQVPVVVAHVAAGAMKLEDRRLVPYKMRDLQILVFPFGAAAKYVGHSILPRGAQPIESGGVRFRDLVAGPERYGGSAVVSDTTVTLGEYEGQSGWGRKTLIGEGELAAASKVISAARNRAKDIMQALELALALDAAQSAGDDHVVVIDGSVGFLVAYAGLVDPALASVVRRLDDRRNAAVAHDMMKRIVGVVKRMVRIPSGLTSVLASPRRGSAVSAYVYLWTKVVNDQAEGSEDRHITTFMLSAIFRLRGELVTENYPVFSPTAGLVRVDVPLPAIMDRGEWVEWVSKYYSRDELGAGGVEEVKKLLEDDAKRRKLAELLDTIYTLRYPVPSANPYRKLVELYPIYEVERWLKSNLMSKYDIATLGLP